MAKKHGTRRLARSLRPAYNQMQDLAGIPVSIDGFLAYSDMLQGRGLSVFDISNESEIAYMKLWLTLNDVSKKTAT